MTREIGLSYFSSFIPHFHHQNSLDKRIARMCRPLTCRRRRQRQPPCNFFQVFPVLHADADAAVVAVNVLCYLIIALPYLDRIRRG